MKVLIFICLSILMAVSCVRRTEEVRVVEKRPKVVKKSCGWSYWDGCHGCEYTYSDGSEVFICEE